jgi:DNA polymerase elongation subunit (family B)
MISRVLDTGSKGRGSLEWSRHDTFKTAGRHVLNLWQILRAEQSFTSYTFENNVFQLLQRRYGVLFSTDRALTHDSVIQYAPIFACDSQGVVQ